MADSTWDFVDNDDSIFGSKQAQIDEFIAQKQSSLEVRVVNHILKHFQAPVLANYVKGKNREAGRPMELNLAGFHAAFPDFPIYLGARHIYKAKDISLNNLKRKFYKNEIYEAYIDLKEEASDLGLDGLVGLVFDWQFDGLTILHNNAAVIGLPGIRLVKTSEAKKDHPVMEIIEPFAGFLETLTWIPRPGDVD